MNGGLHRHLHFAALFGLALFATGALAATAAADGLPVLGIDVGAKGVAARTGSVRYVTLAAGRHTIVARTARNGGRVLGFTRLPGKFTIPAVAYDGSASGLSADGSTLVLIQPRVVFPRARTRFAVMDAKRVKLLERITLGGDYSFDAISPQAKTLFLIQYISPQDPTRYRVRAYDLRARRLRARPVIDPHEREGAMRGSPITRATSQDGRWAYTLYDGAGGTPFVHALDTSASEARCIDLPMLAGRRDLWQMRLGVEPDGSKLEVGTAKTSLALIDTSDFRVTAGERDSTGHHRDRTWQIGGAAALVALLVAAGSIAGRRFRNRSGREPTYAR